MHPFGVIVRVALYGSLGVAGLILSPLAGGGAASAGVMLVSAFALWRSLTIGLRQLVP